MDEVLRGLDDFSVAYLDDIIIYSNTWDKHLWYIRTSCPPEFAGGRAHCKALFHCSYLGHVVV